MGSSKKTHPNPLTYQQEEDEEVGKLLANGVVLPMVLKSALELNLIDIISDAGTGLFLSPSEIAFWVPTKNPDGLVLLDRMLRLLASYSVLKCKLQPQNREDENVDQRVYGVGPICKFLIKNTDEGSVDPLFLLVHVKIFMES